jgi:hypothetical protein
MIEEIKRNTLKEYEAIKLAKLFHDVDNENIKEILTKEQYESNVYKVGDIE